MTVCERATCVLIAAGGTGGHVIPALEVGRELRSKGWECVFVGTASGFENRLVPTAGFELCRVPSGALNRVSLQRRLKTLLAAPSGIAAAVALVRCRRPRAALSLGGYAAGPLVLACALLDVPLVVLEPNATPGLANRLAAPVARRALVCHQAAAAFFRYGSCQFVRLPVRREFFEQPARREGAPFTVLILGGSQGATRLNRAAVGAVRSWRRRGMPVPRLVHQTGPRELEAVRRAYREEGVDAETAAFFDDMPERFGAADLVICRAGASAIAELCAVGRPSVLVPFPHAAHDHQHANAKTVAEAGGALLVADSEWSGDRMAGLVESLVSDRPRLRSMAAATARLAPRGATEAVAAAVVRAAASGEERA